MYAMNVSSTTVLTPELKPFEPSFLSTVDPRISWLKHQLLKYFGDWLTTIEVRPGIYKTCEKGKMFISS